MVEEKEYSDVIEETVYTVTDVPIFKAGKWNGDDYTEQDLDDIVSSFYEIGQKLKPYLKLGHDENQKLLQKDGLPSAGWITGLRRSGKELLATFSGVPKKIKELMDKKAYARVSAEIFWNLKEAGKTYRRALRAVALLGADTPAVTDLDSILGLYTDNDYDKVEIIIYNKRSNNMDYEIKFHELQSTVKEYELKISELEKDAEKKDAEIEKLNAEIKSVNFSKIESEVNAYLEAAVASGKLEPAMKEKYFSLAVDIENKKLAAFETVKSIIDNIEKKVEFSEKSKAIEPKKAPANEEELSQMMHEKAMKYIHDNNLEDNAGNYKIALVAVSKEV